MTPKQRRRWRWDVTRNHDLTHAQRVVLLALEQYADFSDGTNAYPGIDRLAAECDLGRRAVITALKRGRDLKLIEQTARHIPKGGRAAVYRLLPTPEFQGARRCT